eukprot:s2558_g4.t1
MHDTFAFLGPKGSSTHRKMPDGDGDGMGSDAETPDHDPGRDNRRGKGAHDDHGGKGGYGDWTYDPKLVVNFQHYFNFGDGASAPEPPPAAPSGTTSVPGDSAPARAGTNPASPGGREEPAEEPGAESDRRRRKRSNRDRDRGRDRDRERRSDKSRHRHGEAIGALPAPCCRCCCAAKSFAAEAFAVAATRLPSKSWSCSELVRGAAQVVDAMPAQSLDAMVVDEKHKLLGETADLSADEDETAQAAVSAEAAEPVATPARSATPVPVVEPSFLAAKAKAGVMEVIDSDESESEEVDKADLRHAPTLRLDDCHDAPTGTAADPGVVASAVAPSKAADAEAVAWKEKYNELLARLEKIETAKATKQDAFTTPTPKRCFTPASSPPSKAPSSESLCPSPSPPPVSALPKVPPPSAVAPPPVATVTPKPCPPKATAPSVAASSNGDVATTPKAPEGLKAGEEDLAEEVDLSHEDWFCDDMKAVLAKFEGAFLKLAEAQHRLDCNEIPVTLQSALGFVVPAAPLQALQTALQEENLVCSCIR